MRLGLGLDISGMGGAGIPYAAFTQYVAVSSAADYTTDTNVNRWINRASSGATYDFVQTVGANQPTAAVDGLSFDTSDDYMRSSQTATDLQAYIAGSQHPNMLFMHRVTLDAISNATVWSIRNTGGNGYVIGQVTVGGKFRKQLRNSANVTLVTVDTAYPGGDLVAGTYTFADHFHDGVVDSYFAGSLVASGVAFDFSPLWTTNNPFVSANMTIGAQLALDVTPSVLFDGTIHAFAYVNNPTTVPVFP